MIDVDGVYMKLSEMCKLVFDRDTEKRPLTPEEIWNKAVEMGISKDVNLPGGKYVLSVMRTMAKEVRVTPNPIFYEYNRHPYTYYFKEFESEWSRVPCSHLEHHLHPLLVRFIHHHDHFKAYAKTIDQSASLSLVREKQGTNKWLHPDIVGVKFSFENSNPKTHPNESPLQPVTYFSFELKKKVTPWDLDETNKNSACKEAEANSSWANEGYLVVGELDKDEVFGQKLRQWSEITGIGVIVLNLFFDKVDESKIFYKARVRHVNQDRFNLLKTKNADFRKLAAYVDSVPISGIVNEEEFDHVLNDNEIKQHFEGNQIK